MGVLQADPNALIRFSATTTQSLAGVDEAIGHYRRARNTLLSSRTDIAQPPLTDITDVVSGRVAELRQTDARPAHVADKLLQADTGTAGPAPRATESRLYLQSPSAKRSVLFSGPLAKPSRLIGPADTRFAFKPPIGLPGWMFRSPISPLRPRGLVELWRWLNALPQFSGPWHRVRPWLPGVPWRPDLPWQTGGPWFSGPWQPAGPWSAAPWQLPRPWLSGPWQLRTPWTPRQLDFNVQSPWVIEQLLQVPEMLEHLQGKWANLRLPSWLTSKDTVQTAGRFNALLGILSLPDNFNTLINGSGHDNIWRDLLERYLAYVGINLAGLGIASLFITGKALSVPLAIAGGISAAVAAIRWGWDNPRRAAHFTLNGLDKPPQLAEKQGQLTAAAGTMLGAAAAGTTAIAEQLKETFTGPVGAAAGATGPLGGNGDVTAGLFAGSMDLAGGTLSGALDLAARNFTAGGQALESVAGQARTGLRRTGLRMGVLIDRPAPPAKNPKKNREKDREQNPDDNDDFGEEHDRDGNTDYGKEHDRYTASTKH